MDYFFSLLLTFSLSMVQIIVHVCIFKAKDERIVSLETENAMLYLKLAQMRSNLQCSREEVSGLQSQYEGETKFRQNVLESALKFKQELEVKEF